MTRITEQEVDISATLQSLSNKIRELKEIPPQEQINAVLHFLQTSCLPTETDCYASDLRDLLSISRTYIFARIALILNPKEFQSLINPIEHADSLHPFKEINLQELRRNPLVTIQKHINFIKAVYEYNGGDAELYPSPEDIPGIPSNSHGLQADIIRAWQKLLAPEAPFVFTQSLSEKNN